MIANMLSLRLRTLDSFPVIGGSRTTAPCPHFRKAFSLDKPVREARLHITALGLYEAETQRPAVSATTSFASGWTNYNKRVPFQTYDVTLRTW